MQKLGYLVSKTKIRDVADFIEVTTDTKVINESKPMLIVGLDLARNNVKNFSIIKKSFDKGKFWTFGKTERRTDFEKDLFRFYDYTISTSIDNVKYYYVDVVNLSKVKIKNLLGIILSNEDKYIYINKGMFYLYYQNYILGLSLNLLKYCGVKTTKWIKKISLNKHNKIYYTDTNISSFMRQYAKNKKYITPYFFSLAE